MTKEEIKALIAAKIAGQGSAIDAASVLPAILEGIIDLIPAEPTPYELPVASDEVLGGVKVGENLSINEEGVLSASGGGNAALIVTGTIEGPIFVPNEGQPTWEEAGAAITQGRDVIINNSGAGLYHWISFSPDDNSIRFIDTTDTIISWVKE